MRNVNHLRGGRPLAKFVSSQVYETCTRVLRYIYIYIYMVETTFVNGAAMEMIFAR